MQQVTGDAQHFLGCSQERVVIEVRGCQRSRNRRWGDEDVGHGGVLVVHEHDRRVARLVRLARQDLRHPALEPVVARGYRAVVGVIAQIRRDEAEGRQLVGV